MAKRLGPMTLLAGVVLLGCGSQVRSAAPPAARAQTMLHGSPAPLAALHAQADELLGGSVHAFVGRLATLRGFPVVVNKWASWCTPCQSEFPVFQRVAVAYGRRVAFLGLDGNDHTGSARAFLRGYPVSYPSYFDPSSAIATAVGAATYFPQTLYYDRWGRRVFDHLGPYESVSALERDIQRYALSAS